MPAPTSRRPIGARCSTAGCAPCSPGSCPTTACCAGRLRAGAAGEAVRRPARGLRPQAGCRHAAARAGAAAARGPATPGGAWSRPQGARRGRVALLSGCVSPVIQPQINASRHPGAHPPRHRGGAGARARAAAVRSSTTSAASRTRSRPRAPISTPGCAEIAAGGLDAILITASGCGTTVKDYGFMLRGDSAYAGKAARISALARDISEYLAGLDLSRSRANQKA